MLDAGVLLVTVGFGVAVGFVGVDLFGQFLGDDADDAILIFPRDDVPVLSTDVHVPQNIVGDAPDEVGKTVVLGIVHACLVRLTLIRTANADDLSHDPYRIRAAEKSRLHDQP